MITQLLIDWFVFIVSGLLDVIPPPPPGWVSTLSSIQAASSDLGAYISNYGIIVPFVTFSTVLTIWLGAVAFWGAMLLLRAILTAFGR